MFEHDLKNLHCLDFPSRQEGCTWALAVHEGLQGADRAIVRISQDGQASVSARFCAATGNVYAHAGEPDEATPAVLNIGDPNGETGELKAWQASGNYLRVCRWDRVDTVPKNKPNAAFRTLPQCGCGGYLGVPQFFDTFAEMAAYVYCNFCG